MGTERGKGQREQSEGAEKERRRATGRLVGVEDRGQREKRKGKARDGAEGDGEKGMAWR